ncbi:ATP-binding protein [Streptomyces cinereoruber]|uniref:ATP-binding protein n=1 Tax=Streptomyces cinereoruber TaxID=67260 RepID=UPI003EBAFD5A
MPDTLDSTDRAGAADSAGPGGPGGAGSPASRRVRLPHTTAAVPIARSLVRDALARVAPGEADTAELLTAELVANAVRHTAGRGPIELVVEPRTASGDCRIEVHDPAPGRIVHPDPDTEIDPWQEHGRGLFLVRALSSDCGHRPTARGKAAWFTLPAT